ncbi:hypothetical protein [Inquilinus sp. OTU3971]|uniref:hypothetical protein n=1 Tax=Inquilinus sp. OTU3971 TaxID=3043855 RepID=UPI00313CA434
MANLMQSIPRSYYHMFIIPLAQRYLERLSQPLDYWQAYFFRRGLEYFARGIPEGAISALNFMDLTIDRRSEMFCGPMLVQPLGQSEADDIRISLSEIIAAGESDCLAFAMPPPAGQTTAQPVFLLVE